MSSRATPIVLAAALVLAGEAAAAPRPKNFTAELKNVNNQIRRRQYPNALKVLAAMGGRYTDPIQVREIGRLKIQCHAATEEYAAALAEANRLMGRFPAEKDLQAQMLMTSGDMLRKLKKFPEAVAAYRKLAATFPAPPDRAADALLRAGEVHAAELKKYPEALAAYAEVEAKFGAALSKAAEAARRAALIHENNTRDLLKAAALYQSLSEKYAAAQSESYRARYYVQAADCLAKAGKHAEALAVAARAEEALQSDRYKVAAAMKRVDLLTATKKYPQARAEAARIICTYPLELNACHAAQVRVVAAYRLESRFPDALAAARVLYTAAGSDAHLKEAANAVAMAFKAVDGHLGRANEFLTYQRFGAAGPDGQPNTPDDVKVNHLAGVKAVPAEGARDKLFAAAVAAQSDTYEGYRIRGFLHAYWGKGKQSAHFFRLAFKMSSGRQVSPAAAELVMVGMKSHTAGLHGLGPMFEYISYGPKGKSGKEKIPDPFKGL